MKINHLLTIYLLKKNTLRIFMPHSDGMDYSELKTSLFKILTNFQPCAEVLINLRIQYTFLNNKILFTHCLILCYVIRSRASS